MIDHHELTEFRDVLEVLHTYALESPTLNQRGIPRMLERLRNIAAQIDADEFLQAAEGKTE